MEVTLEQLTFLLTVVNSTILALLFLFLKFRIDKRLRKYEYEIGDAGELNRKMHDRLVEIEDCIKYIKPIPQNTITRLQMNASRLEKHDSSISDDVNNLIGVWKEAFLNEKNGAVDLIGVGSKQRKSRELIKVIKAKVDKIVK